MSHIDGILIHRAVEAELSHRLAYVGSTRTDVHGWKADNTAKEARSDHELWLYNATDCVVVARLIEGLRDEMRARRMGRIVGIDHQIQSFCRDAHITGMLVDQARRAHYDDHYKREALAFRRELRELVGNEKLNPNSVPQIAELLFEKWHLPVTAYSEKTGDPSTDDDTLLNLMFRTPGVTPKQAQFCDAVRKFRHATKFRGTYVTKLRRMDEEYEADDDLLLDEEEAEESRKLREARRERQRLRRGTSPRIHLKRGIVHVDGRLRADYNAHGTTSRRLSSSNPNMQNFPRVIRDMLIPAPGHVFVYADMDQLELRAVANLAKCALYIAAFLEGRDPHTETVLTMFAEEGRELLKEAKAWAATPAAEGQSYKKHEFFARARDFAKKFSYACLYRANAPTVHGIIVSATDDNGNLLYPKVTLEEARDRRSNWLGANPELETWWESLVMEYHRDGFLVEPVEGWRRDFLDGEDPNELANFKPQSLGAALVHRATIQLCVGEDAPLRRGRLGKDTGLVQQGHDALVFEVPEAKAKWACGLVTEAMTQRVPGHPIPYTAEAKVYRDFKNELKKAA